MNKKLLAESLVIYMIMLTRSSERFFNPSHYTGRIKFLNVSVYEDSNEQFEFVSFFQGFFFSLK